jgi:hypothetical protein
MKKEKTSSSFCTAAEGFSFLCNKMVIFDSVPCPHTFTSELIPVEPALRNMAVILE